MYNIPVIVITKLSTESNYVVLWTKDAIHLDDFHFTSQVEDMDQLLVDTAKHFGHFIDREEKNVAFNYSQPIPEQTEEH